MKNMETTSSDSKEELRISGKGFVIALDFKTKVRSPKYKKARYAIGNVSEKDISKIIREFEKFEKLPYNLRNVPLTDISDGILCLFVFCRPYFGLESQSGYQPLS